MQFTESKMDVEKWRLPSVAVFPQKKLPGDPLGTPPRRTILAAPRQGSPP